MSITPIGGSSPDWAAVSAVTQGSDNGRGERVMSSVADLLGTSVDDLKAQLQSGQSLADVAASKGVSHDDLVSAIKAGIQNGGQAAPSSTALDAMANRIADRVHHGHHGHHHHTHSTDATAAATSGTSPSPAPSTASPSLDVTM